MKINWKKYEKYEYYTPNSQKFTKCALLGLFTIFFLIVTSFALVEVNNFYNDEPAVLKIFMESFKSSQEQESSPTIKSITNYEDPAKLFNNERQARAAETETTNSTTPKSKSYYEEQTPVVVYSKTDTNPSIALRQMSEVPPRQDNDEEDPYKNPSKEDDYMGSDDDYFGQPEPSSQRAPEAYYRQLHQQQQQQQAAFPYYRQLPPQTYYRQQQQPQQSLQPYYRTPSPPSPYYQSPPNSQYYDDSREDFPGPQRDKQTSEEARGNQYRDYPNYYRQYPYATPPAVAANNKRLQGPNNVENRKMQTAAKAQQLQPNRDPYPSYMDDYDYLASPQTRQPQPPQHPYASRPVPAQTPQYRNPNTAIAPAEQKQESGQQMDILYIIKSLKTMWDLYQSFTSSWSSIAEKRNREEEIAKQKFKQMEQIRINSKKPPKFNNNNNNNKRNSTAANKGGKRTTTTTTIKPDSSELKTSSEEQVLPVKKQPLAKVEPRRVLKGDKASGRDVEGLRDKRQAAGGSSDVGEGRYIKGDPLKGYYDFVITEGSYKFWAAFQVGTAILIIYSTFAAIYYSKVNPLVSDYDYTDYLGGARSLSGGDLDFVDDDAGTEQKAQPKSWLEWLPRTGHSLKFILDAIDKLPVDHEVEYSKTEEPQREQESSEQNENDYEGEEYTDETQMVKEEAEPANEEEKEEETVNDKETQRIDDRDELQNSNESKQAM